MDRHIHKVVVKLTRYRAVQKMKDNPLKRFIDEDINRKN